MCQRRWWASRLFIYCSPGVSVLIYCVSTSRALVIIFLYKFTNSAIFFLSLLYIYSAIFFSKEKKKKNYRPVCQMEVYVLVLWNLRWSGLNCFRKVKSQNASRTPLHFLNSASKSLKSHRWISRANNKLLIEALTLLEEAAPIKWFGGDFFSVCT